MKPAAFMLVLLAALFGGACSKCGNPQPAKGNGAQRYGKLPGLKHTTCGDLLDEADRIAEEGGMPEQLGQSEIPATDNVAAGLKGLFPAKKLETILGESEKIFPPKAFVFNPLQLEKAIRFSKKYDAQHRQIRDALRRPQCDFDIDHEAGFAADLSFVDVARIAARLEAFAVAEALAGDDPAGAVEPLSHLLRLATCLDGEKHPTVRLEAAFVRAEGLNVLQSIVEHPKIVRAHLQQLHKIIEGQLTAWPDDADAWIGDRALGMHAYEVVRAGEILSLLNEEEVEQFRQEGSLEQLPAAARRTADQDEFYYLETMRKIIESCDRPYYMRVALFENIRNDLQKRRDSADFPLVAGRLLLPDIEQGHAIQARDRANCEAWALALARGAGCGPPPYEVNPLTGKKYRLIEEEGRIEVRNVGTGRRGDDPPVVVPDLAGEK